MNLNIRGSMLAMAAVLALVLGACGDDGGSKSAADCSGGETFCSGNCVDTDTDEGNCGSCGATCGASETCSSGVCTGV